MIGLERLNQDHILVTGGAGFIGCAISQRLAPHAASYIVVDNLHPQIHASRKRPAALHEAAELVVGDVTLDAVWENIFGRVHPTIIVHLAAETGTGQSLTEATRHGNVNVVGTTQLVDALGRHGIVPSRIVLASSRAVYGEGAWRRIDGTLVYPGQRARKQLEQGQWDFPALTYEPASAQSTNPFPSSIYGATKLAQEHILRSWTAAKNASLSILRLQNVFGPGQSLTNSYTGIVVLFCRLAKAHQRIPLYEDGEMTRDFVFIDDVADAISAATVDSSSTCTICDIGSGLSLTIGNLARSIAERYRAPAPYVSGKFRDGDVRHASCDVVPTASKLAWSPRWTLQQGLDALETWVDNHLGIES